MFGFGLAMNPAIKPISCASTYPGTRRVLAMTSGGSKAFRASPCRAEAKPIALSGEARMQSRHTPNAALISEDLRPQTEHT